MSAEVEMKLVTCLRDNRDVFAWSTDGLKGIDPRITVHRLNMDPTVKHIRQKRKDFGPIEDAIIAGDVERLMKAGHIEEVRYSDWVCNVFLDEKAPGKWRMCNDFTKLNKFCAKDPYPLPLTDQLVDSTAGCALLSFMDAYQGFYQIRIAQEDVKKTAFFAEGGVYCFKVMPFSLKNAGATYQRLVNKMFREELGKTMEVYVDDMLVKSKTEEQLVEHLNKCFSILRMYEMKLNLEKYTFGMKGGKFLKYMVTERGISANPEKIKAILDLPPPRRVNEVQKLLGRIMALSRFISRSAEKNLPFFKILMKGDKLEWTKECEQALENLKSYLLSPPLLSKPVEGEPLYIYLAATAEAMSSILVWIQGNDYMPIYYLSKALVGAKARFVKIEKLAFALVYTA